MRCFGVFAVQRFFGLPLFSYCQGHVAAFYLFQQQAPAAEERIAAGSATPGAPMAASACSDGGVGVATEFSSVLEKQAERQLPAAAARSPGSDSFRLCRSQCRNAGRERNSLLQLVRMTSSISSAVVPLLQPMPRKRFFGRSTRSAASRAAGERCSLQKETRRAASQGS